MATFLLASLLFAPPVQSGLFVEASASTGLVAQQQGTYGDSFAAGGTVGDFDGDGRQDVYVATGGGAPDRLFMNQGDGTFSEEAASRGLALAHRGTGAVCGDIDGDGDLDLFVTSFGPGAGPESTGQHKLYINDGSGSFTEEAGPRGVAQSSPTQPDGWGGAFGDYDLDGDLDLAVAGWRETFSGNRLFRNDGTGNFTDVTATAGVSTLSGVTGFCPRFADMNGDLYPELIWIGDFGTSRYFVNNGNGTFTDQTGSSGMGLDGTEMGSTVADWDEDGDFDVYVTTISTNNLYINQGAHTFVNQATAAGVDQTLWGWGAESFDYDHDTRTDLFATTQTGRQFVFKNQTPLGGALSFTEEALNIGISTSISGRGISRLDYDDDGDQDLVFFPRNGAITLYRNDVPSGPNARWLRVFLTPPPGSNIAPNGIGSVVRIRLGARQLTSRIDGGSNYLSQSELSAHFGLGSAAVVDEVLVEWTNGQTTTLTNVAANQTLRITPAGWFANFCGGNGGDFAGCTDCPCGNNGTAGDAGCLNSANRSARLLATGEPSVANDTLSFRMQRATAATFAILVSGPNQLPNMGACPRGAGLSNSAFVDGLRCVGGGLLRHGTRGTNSAGDTNGTWGPPGGPTGGLLATNGFSAGQTRAFQAFYREDPTLGCGSGQNTTQGLLVTMAP